MQDFTPLKLNVEKVCTGKIKMCELYHIKTSILSKFVLKGESNRTNLSFILLFVTIYFFFGGLASKLGSISSGDNPLMLNRRDALSGRAPPHFMPRLVSSCFR